MQHKNELENKFQKSTKPEETAMQQLEIQNLKKRIEELNKILEQFSKNNAKSK